MLTSPETGLCGSQFTPVPTIPCHFPVLRLMAASVCHDPCTTFFFYQPKKKVSHFLILHLNQTQKKKSKIDLEGHVFHDKWKNTYFLMEIKNNYLIHKPNLSIWVGRVQPKMLGQVTGTHVVPRSCLGPGPGTRGFLTPVLSLRGLMRCGFRIPSARTIFSTVLPRSLWPGAPGGGQMARVLPTAQPAVQAQPLSAHVSPFFWGGVGRTVSSTFTDIYKSH